MITRSRIAQPTERSEFIDAVLRKLAGVRVHMVYIHELRCREAREPQHTGGSAEYEVHLNDATG